MRISGMSAYSGIYNMQRAGIVTHATAKHADLSPIQPVPGVTNNASGNVSVAAVDVNDIMKDMKAGSKWAIELSEPEEIVNSVAEDVAELVYEQNFRPLEEKF